jgi:kynureninase
MLEIQKKTVRFTAYLEYLLLSGTEDSSRAFRIISPSDPTSRGTHLSILLKPGRLDTLLEMLDEAGIVIDKRKPDVIRVSPMPLYNTYSEVWKFVQIFKAALAKCENEIGDAIEGVAKVSVK